MRRTLATKADYEIARFMNERNPITSHTLQMKILGMKECEGPWYVCEHAVIDSSTGRTYELGRTDWADWDQSGDLVFRRRRLPVSRRRRFR